MNTLFHVLLPDSLTFATPLYGGGLALLVFVAYLFRWIRDRRWNWRSVAELSKLVGLLALAFAVAQPQLRAAVPPGAIPVLLDISDSMSDAEADLLLTRANELAGTRGVAVVPFARRPARSAVTGADTFAETKRRFAQQLDVGGSNLEEALRSVRSSQALLITDGFESSGDAGAAARALQTAGVSLYPLAPEQRRAQSTEGVRITQFSAPLLAAREAATELRVAIENGSDTAQRGLVEVRQGEKMLRSERVELAAGQQSAVTVTSDPLAEGVSEFTTRFVPDSGNSASATERLFVATRERERVLLLNGSPADERFLKAALAGQAFQLTSVVGAEGVAALSFESKLAESSVVILNNIGKGALPSGATEQLRRFVKERAGVVVMIGGERSFGLGGYIGSALEEVLPVEMIPPQTEKKRLNVAVALVLDKSGSMSAGNKLDFAKEAAGQVVANLKDDDFISVTGFDDAPFVVLKNSRVGEIRGIAADRIARLFPAGRTNLLPAIDEARKGLHRADAGRKHMIVLTDGRIPDEGSFYIELAQQMRLMGITLSTVLLGGDSEYSFLKRLAETGGGGFYQTEDARTLPRIFLQDVRVSTGERTLQESGELSVRAGPDGIKSTALRLFPPLQGYVQTKPREGAALELVVTGAGKAEPLLASWRYGAGRAVAFTSDVQGRWTPAWIQWSGFFQFWREVLQGAMERPEGNDEEVRFDLRHQVNKGSLEVEVAVFSRKEPGALSGMVTPPGGVPREVFFEQLAPGRYRAVLPGASAGRYDFALRSEKLGKLTPVAVSVSGELFGERRGQGFNWELLQRLASLTGGTVNPDALADAAGAAEPDSNREPIGRWAVFGGLLLLLLSVLLREGALNGRTVLRRFGLRAR